MADRCGRCGRSLQSGTSVHVGDEKVRCSPCFNDETAVRMGVAFDNTYLEPVELTDPEGVVHRFEVKSLLVPTGHEMIAVEVPMRDDGGGHRFAVLGDFEADAWELFQRLFEKMRREIGERHVNFGDYGWELADGDRLVGRISWDPDPEADESLPLVIIDGRAFKWEEVGRMLRHREGFTVRLSVEDSIEVVGGTVARGKP